MRKSGGKKGHPERVNGAWARQARRDHPNVTEQYSAYIRLHYRQTGQLAPGCDNRDLQAWYEQDEAQP